jgi:hypothetical protein
MNVIMGFMVPNGDEASAGGAQPTVTVIGANEIAELKKEMV